jgi:Restriction endonuclease
MPKRSNEFQRIVKYIYSQVGPAGGRVTESALLREDGTGEQREVDVLIEHKVAGHDIKIAVECRDHTRDQDVGWIDSLIGKYSRLNVNKIVAVSSTPFSEAAKEKGEKHGIDVIAVNEALTTDWINHIERWRGMTHSFTLKRIVTQDANGNVLTWTDVSDDGTIPTHRDQLSEKMYGSLQHYFFKHVRKDVAQALDAKIGEKWQTYIDDQTPRWAEFTQHEPPQFTIDGKDMGIERIVFGVGTFFYVGRASDHFALKELALSQFKLPLMKGEATFGIITDPQGRVLKFVVTEPMAWKRPRE